MRNQEEVERMLWAAKQGAKVVQNGRARDKTYYRAYIDALEYVLEDEGSDEEED